MSYTFEIHKNPAELPSNWDDIIGSHNVMLSQGYLCALYTSAPSNMKCYHVAVFQDNELIGGVIFQYLDFQYHSTFQRNEVWCSIRNFLARRYSKNVMILGNNMLTGQNGFYFDTSKISVEELFSLLMEIVQKMQKEIGKTSLIIFKDYQESFFTYFNTERYSSYYKFTVQPNMMLDVRDSWNNFDDYLNDFSKKYRSRAKSAKNKLVGIEKHEMSINDIKKHREVMDTLYQNVAENAPFNTFFLSKNHFEEMKKELNESFRVFGYFLNKRLIGFYTLILNAKDIDTYFLGYDKLLQKDKQVYLNMLFDMVEFGIKNHYQRIIFGRTALEIKSTIGAEPVKIFGLIKHRNKMLNRLIKIIFPSVNPETEWIQRKPFKEND
ncbi:peptidogalycan biosysnthesis protein [Chryseobacterium fistulae]|uniref:8-amino-7-oxononanoate synthase n=1 Tax=Chryseobacterium fistulae TaxID=2675058 RepID=A0A6N4XST2_9FLAO|nr:peptidogalycan biosysnthesis protein [Chryseobacterium fistulae]CAA7389011.1 hypothetical protein CHRY9393_02065 [Chryseobacterium fistulae]